MIQDGAHESIWKTSDFLVGLTMALGMLIEYFVVDWDLSFSPVFRAIFGFVLTVSGFFLIASSRKEFSRAKQPRAPGIPTTQIIDTGVFGFSRNPLYLGIVLILPGLGFLFNIVWWVILTPLLLAALHWLLIIPEEQYLESEFKEVYENYRKRVRRWI